MKTFRNKVPLTNLKINLKLPVIKYIKINFKNFVQKTKNKFQVNPHLLTNFIKYFLIYILNNINNLQSQQK